MNNKNTEFSGTKVLVLDGGSRQILPILRGLHDIGCHITSFNGAKTNNGYLSKYPDEKILCRSVNDGTEALEDAILREVKTGKYDVLMPLSDGSTDAVTQNLEELKQYVKIPVPTREVFYVPITSRSLCRYAWIMICLAQSLCPKDRMCMNSAKESVIR